MRALQIKKTSAYRPGNNLLINGAASAVGHPTVQIANALGATATTGDNSPEKAKDLIGDIPCNIIDLGASDLHDIIHDQVHAAARTV